MQSVVDTLRERLPNLLAVYWFGSRAQDLATVDSDWDFAVLVQGKVGPDLLWDLAGELATALRADVDLMDLRAVSTVMQYQIITTGQRVWAADLGMVGIVECAILSDKAELDAARAPHLQDIWRTGKVYGE